MHQTLSGSDETNKIDVNTKIFIKASSYLTGADSCDIRYGANRTISGLDPYEEQRLRISGTQFKDYEQSRQKSF